MRLAALINYLVRRNDDIDMIREGYGDKAQALMLVEEMSELTKEVMKEFARGQDRRSEIREELVDTIIMLYQLCGIMDYDCVELIDVAKYKIDRAVNRHAKKIL